VKAPTTAAQRIAYNGVGICMDNAKKGALTANTGQQCEQYTGYNFQPIGNY
jgi:hypothetical protein